jgi:hypothetical protein
VGPDHTQCLKNSILPTITLKWGYDGVGDKSCKYVCDLKFISVDVVQHQVTD